MLSLTDQSGGGTRTRTTCCVKVLSRGPQTGTYLYYLHFNFTLYFEMLSRHLIVMPFLAIESLKYKFSVTLFLSHLVFVIHTQMSSLCL